MGTFGVKRASDEYFCPSTVATRVGEINNFLVEKGKAEFI